MARTFPTAPLIRALHARAERTGCSLVELAELLGIDRRTVQRLPAHPRIDARRADSLAVALGKHPCEIWPEWFAADASSAATGG